MEMYSVYRVQLLKLCESSVVHIKRTPAFVATVYLTVNIGKSQNVELKCLGLD